MGRHKILVVYNEPDSITALMNILSPEYTLLAADNELDAFKIAVEFMPDLIMLDVIMPAIDGYSVLKSMKENPVICDIPVIYITGQSETGSEGRALSIGAADYIAKPLTPGIVRLRVYNQFRLISHMNMLIKKELEEQSHNAKVEMLMNMSHEMLTPMNVIMGMTQIAKRSDDSAVIEDCLEDIEFASKRLLEMIKKLLSFEDT